MCIRDSTCIFLISIRDDDIVILHLPMGKCLHHLALLRISPACILFYNGHIVQGLLVALVNLENLVQAAPGLIKDVYKRQDITWSAYPALTAIAPNPNASPMVEQAPYNPKRGISKSTVPKDVAMSCPSRSPANR